MATALEQNVQITDSNVGLSREASEMLKRITQSIKNIKAMNEQIACAAEQQGTAGEEISRCVTKVRDISDQTAAASEETASSSMELARISVMPAGDDPPLQGIALGLSSQYCAQAQLKVQQPQFCEPNSVTWAFSIAAALVAGG